LQMYQHSCGCGEGRFDHIPLWATCWHRLDWWCCSEFWEFRYSRVRAIHACEPWVQGSKVEVWEHLPWAKLCNLRNAVVQYCPTSLQETGWDRKAWSLMNANNLSWKTGFVAGFRSCVIVWRRWISCGRIVGSEGTSLWGEQDPDWSSAGHGDCLLCLRSRSVLY
jgi:hypothetical protein